MSAGGNGLAGWLRGTVGRGSDDVGSGPGSSDGWGGPDDVTVVPAPRTEAIPPAPREPGPSATSVATPQRDELPAEPVPPPVGDQTETGGEDGPDTAIETDAAATATSSVDETAAAEPRAQRDTSDPTRDPAAGTGAGTGAGTIRPTEQRPAPWRRAPRRLLVALALLLAVALAAVLVVAVVRSDDDAVPAAAQPPVSGRPAGPPSPPVAAPPPRAELPRGGTTIFPRHRVVAFYGTPDTDVLGVLGEGTPEEAADRLDEAARAFATPDREVQPAMEIIATVADGSPGPDGNHSHDVDPAAVRRYIDVARAHGQLVVLDLQPGSSDFLTVAKRWEPFLSEPDVSLALDPEWRMEPGEVPGQVIGNVSAAEINQVSDWLAGIVRTRNLPQKMLVLHQFTPDMIGDPETIATPQELAVVQHIDGFGAPQNKIAKYQELRRPQHLHPGFKLFYDEDTPMLTPEQTLGLAPAPEFVTFQ